MNPTCTIKASQAEKTRQRKAALKAVGAAPKDDGRADRAASATAASKLAGARRRKAEEAAKMEPMGCPAIALINAARAGDEYAAWQADNIYGKTWRKR